MSSSSSSIMPLPWGAREEEGQALLSNERAFSSVRSDAMATYIYGGEAALHKRLAIVNLIESDPIFSSEDRPHHNQKERYMRAAEKAVAFVKKCQALKLSYEETLEVSLAVDEIMPINVHMKMFVPTLMYQTSPEQRAKLLPLAQNFSILGAYAQTELGHGSNVRAMETTATYCKETETFIMHSPTLTSMKWWPGGLGKTATHAVVLARLIIDNKDHGLIERACLTLARGLTIAVRYSCVRRQGYASDGITEMKVIDYPTQRHALMPLLAWAYALQATGSYMRDTYKSYLRKYDPILLGNVHALSSGLKSLTAELVTNDIDLCRRMCGGHGYMLASGLPEVFGNYTAVNTFEGTQQVLEPQLARFLLKIASGHASSKSLSSDDTKYIKEAKKMVSIRCAAKEARDFLNPALQIEAFSCRSAALVAQAGVEIQAWMMKNNAKGGKKGGEGSSSLSEAISAKGVLLGQLSRAHCQLIILKRFHESVAAQEKRLMSGTTAARAAKKKGVKDDDVLIGQAEVRVLRSLVSLYALSVMEKEMGEFRRMDYMTSAQAAMIPHLVMNLCGVVRMECVSLVDAFKFSDKHLSSALGRYDGKVYSTLYQTALQSPLNAEEVTEAYCKHWVKLTHSQGGGGSRL